MNHPSILRHSKAHRAAVARNAAAMFETHVTLECDDRHIKELVKAIQSGGYKRISHCILAWANRTRFVVALRDKPLILPAICEVTKTEKVRL